jgi:hypothetical protein
VGALTVIVEEVGASSGALSQAAAAIARPSAATSGFIV